MLQVVVQRVLAAVQLAAAAQRVVVAQTVLQKDPAVALPVAVAPRDRVQGSHRLVTEVQLN